MSTSNTQAGKPYTTTQAAAVLARDYGLSLSARTVARYIDRNIIAGYRTPGGDRRVLPVALSSFGEQHR
jgi:hypothetical protein